MPNQSLTDLPERTSTSGSDRIHVNNAGTDYQQTKDDFLRGDLLHTFSNTTSLTSQVDALPNGTYYGSCSAGGHQSETGAPVNAIGYVEVQKIGSNNAILYFTVVSTGDRYFKKKASGTWDSAWTQDPTRAEISALNNSLTNIRTSGQFLGYKDKYITNVSISYDNSYASLGDVYNDFGIPSGAYVISFLIRGWSGASGTLMLIAGSDGKTIYLMSNKAGTIGSITVRVWYAILN